MQWFPTPFLSGPAVVHGFCPAKVSLKETDQFRLWFESNISIGEELLHRLLQFSGGSCRGNPDDVVAALGADTMRTYEMFMGPIDAMKAWSTGGVEGVRRFYNRVWDLSHQVIEGKNKKSGSEVLKRINKLVKKVVDTIITINKTGKSGDGKIFVLPISESIRIRTGESGEMTLDEE